MSFCRSLDVARSVSSSRQNTEKHGGQKKKVRPQRSHTGRRWAQHTEKVQSTRMITWKEDQKIKLQKFICECIYNWLFFLKTFFSFFSLFNFFFQPIQLCYIEAKHSCYVCSVSVQHAGSSPPLLLHLLFLLFERGHRCGHASSGSRSIETLRIPPRNRLANSTFPSETKPLNRTQKRRGYLWLELLWRGAGRPQTTCRSLAGHRVSLLRQYI